MDSHPHLCQKPPKEDILNYADSFTSRSLGSSRVIRFAYIGSVNNIIDIHLIVSLLSKINNHTKTELVIIGNGEKIDELKQMLLKSKIIVKDYGTVYSDEAKEKILVDCHYGLNVMKSSVFVGATMKSLDYLYFGLPLINTIVEDTWNLVNTEECGINLSENNVDFVAKRIIDMSEVDYSKMSENARIAFDRLFSVESVLNALESFFNRN